METPAVDTVSSIMTDRVLAVTAQTPLDTALTLMAESRVRHLPVLDGERCVGLLHETDILWTLWTHGATGQTAGGCCRTPASSVHPDDSVVTAAGRISREGGDAAMVTANGTIVGILTAVDIVRYLGTQSHG